MASKRFVGIFVNPMYAQSDGIDAVLDRCESMGATAIATTPNLVMPDENGHRIPELHVDGYARVLARPVFGKTEFNCRPLRAFEADPARYSDTPYRPPGTGIAAPDDINRDLPLTLVKAARARGLAAYVQVTPFIPPGIRPEDQPQRIDGTRPQAPQVAMAGCLNAPRVRAYARALVSETLTQYEALDGFLIDWAEYGAYALEDLFTCFCPHCKAAYPDADWDRITRDAERAFDALHRLGPAELQAMARSDEATRQRFFEDHQGLLDLADIKRRTVRAVYLEVRQELAATHPGAHLVARGWAPPLNLASGLDFGALAGVADEFAPKLFTFDFNALPRWYAEVLQGWNRGADAHDLLTALLPLLDLPDGLARREMDDYRIPGPGEEHHAEVSALLRRVEQVREAGRGKALIRPFVHAYLNEPKWSELLQSLHGTATDGIWVQMYGYLSDEKAQALERAWGHDKACV